MPNLDFIRQQGTRFIVLSHDQYAVEARQIANELGAKLRVRNHSPQDGSNDISLINLTHILTPEDYYWAHGIIYWFDCTDLDIQASTAPCGTYGVNAYFMNEPKYTEETEKLKESYVEDTFQWNSPNFINRNGEWELEKYSQKSLDTYIIEQDDVIQHQDPLRRLQNIFADEQITFDKTLFMMATPILSTAFTTVVPKLKVDYIKENFSSGQYDNVAFLNLDEAMIPAGLAEIQKVCDILHRDGTIKPDQIHYFTADERIEELYEKYSKMLGADYHIHTWGCRTFELNSFPYCHHLGVQGKITKDETSPQDLDMYKNQLKRPVVPRAKRFLSFNRVPKGDRLQHAAFLLRNPKIKQQTLMSCGIWQDELDSMHKHLISALTDSINAVEESEHFDPKDLRRTKFSRIEQSPSINCYADYRGTKRILQDMNTLWEHRNSFPWSIDISAERVKAENPASVSSEAEHEKLYTDTVVQIVHETLYYATNHDIVQDKTTWSESYRVSSFHDPTVYSLPMNLLSHMGSIFFSEKTFKPIVWKQPFIVYATPGHLAALRETGYRTFHPIIDETYDTVESDMQRMELIEAEIRKISEMSDSEVLAFEQQCREVVEHNYNWFFTPHRRLAVGTKKLHKYIS